MHLYMIPIIILALAAAVGPVLVGLRFHIADSKAQQIAGSTAQQNDGVTLGPAVSYSRAGHDVEAADAA